METRANFVLVGSSVLAAIATIVGFIFWLAHSELTHNEDVYYTYFTGSVVGLSSGSTVRYRGVPVGTVGNIEIDPNNVVQIRVTLKLKPSTPVKTDTIASLEVQGITGGAYIELTGGTQASLPLVAVDDNVPVIKSENSTLQSVLDDAPKVLGKLNQLADSANSVLSADNVKAISETFHHLDSLSASLDSMGPDAKQAVTNFNQISGDLHKRLPEIVDTIHQDGASIRDAANGFGKLANDIDAVVAENRAPLRDFTANGLGEVSGLVSNLRALTDTLNRVADHLDRDPQRYLFGGSGGGIDPSKPLPGTAGGSR
jgi:phospholipid/cholesterol/gamma-HCH transport system substrate-binding protein